MGVDLTIYPVFLDQDFCHDRITFNRDETLFDKIAYIEWTHVNNNRGIRCYHDSTYSFISRDCYGDKLVFITAKDLRAIQKTPEFKNTCVKNKEIIKFLSTLKPYKLVLYWH
jgi:hypothetical protein